MSFEEKKTQNRQAESKATTMVASPAPLASVCETSTESGPGARASWAAAQRRSTRRVIPAAEETTPVSGFSNPVLPQLWMGDVFVALSVTAAVAPALTVVDKAIVEQSTRSGERGVLLQSMKRTAGSILTNPVGYFRSPTFGWMWLTYACTYTAANTMKTWNEQANVSANRKAKADLSKPVKKKATSNSTFLIAGTTLVNSGASLIKDRAYARMFGQSPRPVPIASYVAWAVRDGVVIGSSFVLPAHVTPMVQEMTGWSYASASTASQLFTPVAAQLVAGPLHLWGLTLYNASAGQSLRQKLAVWQSGLASVTGARMLRILPGYGVAGVVNQRGRAWWKRHLLQAQVKKHHHDPSTLVALIRSAASKAG